MAVLIAVGIIIYIKILMLCLYSAFDKQEMKENNIDRTTINILEQIPGNKKIITNMYIKDNRKTNYIEHILINKNGIFVIETKNLLGTIYGEEISKKWTQQTNKEKIEFENPIFKNYADKYLIEKVVENRTTVTPIVAFTMKCKLKVKVTGQAVLYVSNLQKFIQSQKEKLTDEQIEEYYNKMIEKQIESENPIREQNYNANQYV